MAWARLQDAQQIVSALSGVSNVVVVGTSFIGVESAAGIRGKNDVRPFASGYMTSLDHTSYRPV
jgi:hypothetical protein